jgi:hypothetical protein
MHNLKYIICSVSSGMCNRLIPFITSYRLAMKLNIPYYLHWDDKCNDMDYKYIGTTTTYDDMFEKIHGVNYLDNNELYKLLSDQNKTLRIGYMQSDLYKYSVSDILKYDVIYFTYYTHPVYIKEDNIIIENYSSIDWIINKSTYLKDIQKYFEYLKPVKNIQNKIDEVLCIFPDSYDNIIGFHIRHWPSNWECDNKNLIEGNMEQRIKLMKEAIEKNNNIKFYICSTNLIIIKMLINLFGERIIYFKNRFGNNQEDMYYTNNINESVGNIYKNLNGVVDLFLLSKCNTIIGDVASSYSINSTLLNKHSTYIQIKNEKY